jgi:SAM-dependent methyltransferase
MPSSKLVVGDPSLPMNENEPKKAWLSTAEDDDVFSDIVESRHVIVFPWLIAIIRELKPNSVLDYGAGDGKFLAQLRERFAGELWHYDPSPALTAKAKRLLQDADVRFCQDAKSLNGESVDVVTSIAVWMTLFGYQACVDYLSEQHRLLHRGGRAFVVVTHPCFREERYSSFKTQFKNDGYLRDGIPFTVDVFDRDRAVQFVDYHWNLSTMLRQSREVGFQLLAVTELPDATDGNPRAHPGSASSSARTRGSSTSPMKNRHLRA